MEENIIYKATSEDGKYKVVCLSDGSETCTFTKTAEQQSGETQQMSRQFSSRNAAKHYINEFMTNARFMGIKYTKEVDKL